MLIFTIGDFINSLNSKCIEVFDVSSETWYSGSYNQVGRISYGMVPLNNGRILIAGGNASTGSGANNTCWLVTDNTEIVSNSDLSKEININLYPNPSTQLLNVELGILDPAIRELDFHILDASGRLVKKEIQETQILHSVDVSQLPAGSYQLSIFAGHRQLVSKGFSVSKQ